MRPVKLKNLEGCFLKDEYIVQDGRDELVLAAYPFVSWSWMFEPDNKDMEIPLMVRKRRFRYFDREGRYWIYKEVREK